MSSLLSGRNSTDYCKPCDDELDDVCNPSLKEDSSSWRNAENGRVQEGNEGWIVLDSSSYISENGALGCTVRKLGESLAKEDEDLVGGGSHPVLSNPGRPAGQELPVMCSPLDSSPPSTSFPRLKPRNSIDQTVEGVFLRSIGGISFCLDSKHNGESAFSTVLCKGNT